MTPQRTRAATTNKWNLQRNRCRHRARCSVGEGPPLLGVVFDGAGSTGRDCRRMSRSASRTRSDCRRVSRSASRTCSGLQEGVAQREQDVQRLQEGVAQREQDVQRLQEGVAQREQDVQRLQEDVARRGKHWRRPQVHVPQWNRCLWGPWFTVLPRDLDVRSMVRRAAPPSADVLTGVQAIRVPVHAPSDRAVRLQFPGFTLQPVQVAEPRRPRMLRVINAHPKIGRARRHAASHRGWVAHEVLRARELIAQQQRQ